MTQPSIASSMRAWQYSDVKGGLETALKLNPNARMPVRKPNQHLVKISATALNPVDHKVAEIPYIGRLLVPNPATPGCDFAGHIIEPASGSSLEPGQAVLGVCGKTPFAGGAMAEYGLAEKDSVTHLPDGVSFVDAASIGIAGLTAFQSILPYVKSGDKVFINGGSGGVGVFGIQLAKAKGLIVTTTCSTTNVELCNSLGADEVIDYRTQDVVQALKASGPSYNHVVDNVGSNHDIFWRCHEYTQSGAIFVSVGATPSLGTFIETAKMKFLPTFLGGGQRKYAPIFAQAKSDELEQIASWMQKGTIRAVIDTELAFADGPKAFAQLRTGRTKGKVVVNAEK